MTARTLHPTALPMTAGNAPSLVATIALWRRRARTRAELAQLDTEQLTDIGVAREDAIAEAAKPFWRA